MAEILNYDLLYECESVEQVREGLDKLGVPANAAKREIFLNQFMGVTKSFGCGKPEPDEDYAVACEELVFMNIQRRNGRIK